MLLKRNPDLSHFQQWETWAEGQIGDDVGEGVKVLQVDQDS